MLGKLTCINTHLSNKNYKHQYCCSLRCEIAWRCCLIGGRAARPGACLTFLWDEHPFTWDWGCSATYGTVDSLGVGSALGRLGLSHATASSCAALVAKGLDVLFTCRAGLGSGALRGGIRLRSHDTVTAAWGLAEARSAGDSRAVTSAGPGIIGHELGTDITAVDVSYSASGWIVREAEAARTGRGSRVVTAVEHPISA